VITPTKGIAPQRALLSVAAQISIVLTEPMTVSQVWVGLQKWRTRNGNDQIVSFAWFVLALDVLFMLGAVILDAGLIHKVGVR